jgi:Xaa-Pro aminopeptidase
VSARADAVAAVVAERELDALLVVEEFNLRWLTAYTGTNGLALVGDDLACS